MTQSQLQFNHNHVMMLISQYTSGILLLTEFQKAISNLQLDDVAGLIDPASGLRYP